MGIDSWASGYNGGASGKFPLLSTPVDACSKSACNGLLRTKTTPSLMKKQKKLSWAAPCSGNATVSLTAGAQDAAVVPLQFFLLLCSIELPNTQTLSRKTYISQTCVFCLRSSLICRYADILYVWVSDGWRVCVWPGWVFILRRHIIFCSQAEEKLLFCSLKIICRRPKRESVLPEYIAWVAAFVPLQFFRPNTPHSSQTLFELSCTRYTSLGMCPQERILDSAALNTSAW